MPLAPLSKRSCLCGCGALFTPVRSDQKYATGTCKTRAYRNRHKPSWFDLLTPADKQWWSALRESANPIGVRIALAVELEGKTFGTKFAVELLYKAEFIWSGFEDGGRARLERIYPADTIDQVTAILF